MKVGILLIATGKYFKFFKPLYDSLMKNFLSKHERTIFYFTDSNMEVPNNVIKTKIERKGFPGDTLFRYHYFLKQKQNILKMDAVYYMDVDSFVKDVVGDEILPNDETPLIGCAHPGFYKTGRKLGTPERRPASTAYISTKEQRDCYICGGFNGGLSKKFVEMAETISSNIDKDGEKNMIAVWHDESHINRYYVTNKKLFKILTPSYMFPESWTNRWNLKGLKPRILALDKNHSEIRKPLV